MLKLRYFVFIALLFFSLPISAQQPLNARIEFTEIQQDEYIDVSWANPKDQNWREHRLYIAYFVQDYPLDYTPKPLKGRQAIAVMDKTYGDIIKVVFGYIIKYDNDDRLYLYDYTYGNLLAVSSENNQYMYSYPDGKREPLNYCTKLSGCKGKPSSACKLVILSH